MDFRDCFPRFPLLPASLTDSSPNCTRRKPHWRSRNITSVFGVHIRPQKRRHLLSIILTWRMKPCTRHAISLIASLKSCESRWREYDWMLTRNRRMSNYSVLPNAAQGSEGGLAAQAVGVVAGSDEQGRGIVGTDAAAGQQPRAVHGDRVGEPLFWVVDLLGQPQLSGIHPAPSLHDSILSKGWSLRTRRGASPGHQRLDIHKRISPSGGRAPQPFMSRFFPMFGGCG